MPRDCANALNAKTRRARELQRPPTHQDVRYSSSHVNGRETSRIVRAKTFRKWIYSPSGHGPGPGWRRAGGRKFAEPPARAGGVDIRRACGWYVRLASLDLRSPRFLFVTVAGPLAATGTAYLFGVYAPAVRGAGGWDHAAAVRLTHKVHSLSRTWDTRKLMCKPLRRRATWAYMLGARPRACRNAFPYAVVCISETAAAGARAWPVGRAALA